MKENYISVVKLFVVYFKFYESIIILGQAYIFKYLCHHLQEMYKYLVIITYKYSQTW